MPKEQRRLVNNPKHRPTPERWNGDVLSLGRAIGKGLSAIVFCIDDERVAKTYLDSDEMETERKAYAIIEEAPDRSPHIITCFELDNPRGLVLELCQETVRQRVGSLPEGVFPSDIQSRTWAKQAAEGLAFIHQHDIIHADVGCHNMLLNSSGILKLCDFGGSSVNGSRASMKYEVWSRPPFKENSPPTTMSDLFALGSAIYEMSTKEEPYRGKSPEEIPKLYQKGQFPPVEKIASLGQVIITCWLQKYTSATDIVHEIDPQLKICCNSEGERVEELRKADTGLRSSSLQSQKSTTLTSWAKSEPTRQLSLREQPHQSSDNPESPNTSMGLRGENPSQNSKGRRVSAASRKRTAARKNQNVISDWIKRSIQPRNCHRQ
jgi:serine/threonine protein kinase